MEKESMLNSIKSEEDLVVPGIIVRGAEGKNRKIIEEEITKRERQEEIARKEQGKHTSVFYEKIHQDNSVFDGFLELLREKEIPVSTPEWMQFIKVVQEKTKPEKLKNNDQLLNTIRLYAKTILVKNKKYEASFHEAFDEYFQSLKKVFEQEMDKIDENIDEDIEPEIKDQSAVDNIKDDDEEKKERDSETEPDIKDQLGIDEVDENLDNSEDGEHSEDEQIHGGKKDQHNDILKKEDLSKKGGGNKKDEESGMGDKNKASEGKGDKGAAGEGKGDKGDFSGMGKGSDGLENNNKDEIDDNEKDGEADSEEENQKEVSEKGSLVGGGKGNFKFAENNRNSIIKDGERVNDEIILAREKEMKKVDQKSRYEKRPDKASMREIIKNLRRIITDISDIKSNKINKERTVKNFAKKDFRFEYEREREKQPEVVLFIDVGGPVDEWSPLIKEVTESMTKGLTKLETYLFHNNLYGYVWKPDKKDLLASNYAKPNSLIDIKSIVKKRKKVIIYGDAEMSYSEFESDEWPPDKNDDRIERFEMGGDECLEYIEKKSDSAVWINPVFKKEWKERDDSGSINAIKNIIPMHDLTVGGVEDAVKKLMKK